MEKHGKPTSQAQRLQNDAFERFLGKSWRNGDPRWQETSEWFHSVVKESCTEYTIPLDAAPGITKKLINLLLPQFFSPSDTNPIDPWKHPGGAIAYLRREIQEHVRRIHDELQDEALQRGWREGNPDWDGIKRRVEKMAKICQRDIDKVKDLAQGALEVMVEWDKNGKRDIPLIRYIWGVLRNLRTDQYHQDRCYVELPIDYVNVPDKTDYHHAASAAAILDKRIEILDGIDDEEIRELIDSARHQRDLLASLAAGNSFPESASGAETVEELVGWNQQLLSGWNHYRKMKNLPPKTMEDLENAKRRIQRRVQHWILNTALNRACSRCECSFFGCSHADLHCDTALQGSDFKVVDVRGAECKDPGRLAMACAVCPVCARIAAHWYDLQLSFEMSRKDSTEMWTTVFTSLGCAARKLVRSTFVELQHHLVVVGRLDTPNALAHLMIQTATEGVGEAARAQLANHLAYNVLDDFLSGKLPCHTGDVLREVFIGDVRRKIEEAKAAIRLAAEAAAHEAQESKENPAKQIERQETQVLDEKVADADRVLQLHIDCNCIPPRDTGSSKDSSGYFIQAIIPAAQAPRPGEKTVICRCGEIRNFRITGEGHSNQKEPSYDSIKGSFEPDVQVSARQANATKQEKIRSERALSYLRISYQQWMTAIQTAPI